MLFRPKQPKRHWRRPSVRARSSAFERSAWESARAGPGGEEGGEGEEGGSGGEEGGAGGGEEGGEGEGGGQGGEGKRPDEGVRGGLSRSLPPAGCVLGRWSLRAVLEIPPRGPQMLLVGLP